MMDVLLKLAGWNLVQDFFGWGKAAQLKDWGVLAEFESPAGLYQACEKVRDAGFSKWDAHTPFPVHGLEKAMGIPSSRIPWIALATGLTGASIGFLLQTWVHAITYPLVISGKPYWAWPTYVPITFELGVLLTALGALLGMLAINQLPRLHHPLFGSERFERFSDDRFFISIEAVDPNYDEEGTAALLREAGALHVEQVAM
jgi:hypothetical protein